MIFSNTSNYMLKYQKAKAKLVEYDIPQKDYPKFPLNSNELSYPVVYILSRYAESVIENNIADMEEFSPHLVAASQYFDAAVGANDRAEYDVDFLLSGAASYFLSDDFGSAKVLLKPAEVGTGVIAGGSVRPVLELAGYKNIRTKVIGTNNPRNVVYATIEGLKSMQTIEQVAKKRGKKVEDIL